MKVLTVYAHDDPNSFCHAVLERFTDGLHEAGHTSEVLDLYADGFDPVFRDRDAASYTSATIPEDVLAPSRPSSRAGSTASGRWTSHSG